MNLRRFRVALAVTFAAALLLHARDEASPSSSSQEARAVAFVISSKAFAQGGNIPKKFTCDGADVSPELSWTNPPSGTKSFALVADDPDAPVGVWTHWVILDLPPGTVILPEGVSQTGKLSSGALQGLNDFGKIGYNGPCPPPGKPHRYFFKLYALDRKLGLKPGRQRHQLDEAMRGHVLGEADYMGNYGR